MSNYRFKWPSADQLIAGVASGGLSTCILHPLDLIKTQFQVNSLSRDQVNRRPFLYTFRYLRDLYFNYGLRRGLYQGLSANLAGSTASWGLYFFVYEWIKDVSSLDSSSMGKKRKFAPQNYFLASSAAAALTVVFTNPLWMIKTRLCMQVPGQEGNYRGLLDAFVKISRTEGLRGLYRGLIPGLFGVSHGAVQFMFYEEFKRLLDRKPVRNVCSLKEI
jgi:solute carrier family 25 folate transporter 32